MEDYTGINNGANHKLVRHTRFNNVTATEEVWYSLWYEDTTFWRKRKVWKPVETISPSTYRTYPVSGDYEWATKIAEHYNIEVPSR